MAELCVSCSGGWLGEVECTFSKKRNSSWDTSSLAAAPAAAAAAGAGGGGGAGNCGATADARRGAGGGAVVAESCPGGGWVGFSSMTGCAPLAASQWARSDGSKGQGGRGASSTSSREMTACAGSLQLLPCAFATTCASEALLLQKPYKGSTLSSLHALLMSSGSSLLRRHRRRKRSASCSSWNSRNSTSGTSACIASVDIFSTCSRRCTWCRTSS
jgi:hypothetical protein